MSISRPITSPFHELIQAESNFALPFSYRTNTSFKETRLHSISSLVTSKSNSQNAFSSSCYHLNQKESLTQCLASTSTYSSNSVRMNYQHFYSLVSLHSPHSHFLPSSNHKSSIFFSNSNFYHRLEKRKFKKRNRLLLLNSSTHAVSDIINNLIPNSNSNSKINELENSKFEFENSIINQTSINAAVESPSSNSKDQNYVPIPSKNDYQMKEKINNSILLETTIQKEAKFIEREEEKWKEELDGSKDNRNRKDSMASSSTSSSTNSSSSSPLSPSSVSPSPPISADSSSSSPSISSSNEDKAFQSKSKNVEAAWGALVRWSRSFQSTNKKINDNVLMNTNKITVLGGGSFGTAIAVMLARNKPSMDVVLLVRKKEVADSINNDHTNSKYFPNHILPLNVRATIVPKDALEDTQYCFHAVPVQSSTKFLQEISEYVPPNLPIFSVSKGLEVSTLEMMSELIPRALQNNKQPIVVLSGPSFSIELMDELPTGLVAASKDAELARAAQQLLASNYLRVNTSSDVVGVEMAGALKNVLAIAAGIVEGMKLGNNCMAALVAQGCAEIRWLAEKMGGNPATLSGLSGTGDIMLTCFVRLSRNRSVGVRLGAGEKLEDILASMNQVAEGVATAGAVIALARKYRVQMPVLTAVARILENELTPKKAVMELMSLPQVEEK